MQALGAALWPYEYTLDAETVCYISVKPMRMQPLDTALQAFGHKPHPEMACCTSAKRSQMQPFDALRVHMPA